MIRFTACIALAIVMSGSAFAQQKSLGSLLGNDSPSPTPKPSATPAKKDKDQTPSGPTIITADQEATFDEKQHVATFLGHVKVVSPQFTMTCDKLTAYLNADNGENAASPSPSPAAKTPKPAKTPADDNNNGGGLDHAVAEGSVVIVQQKPPANKGDKPQVNIGKSKTAYFNNKTGEMILHGWPQLQQGINTHIALAESTVMTLHKDGHLKTDGPSRTVIQDQPDEPSPTPSSTPTPSANRSPFGTF